MRRLRWLLLLLGVGLPATTLLPAWAPTLQPDLFAVLLLFAAWRAPHEQALVICWIAGIARDLLGGGPPGPAALLYLMAGLVLMWIRRALNTENFILQALLGASTAYAAGLALLLPDGLSRGALHTLAGAALLTGAITPPAFWALGFTRRWLGLTHRRVFGVR